MGEGEKKRDGVGHLIELVVITQDSGECDSWILVDNLFSGCITEILDGPDTAFLWFQVSLCFCDGSLEELDFFICVVMASPCWRAIFFPTIRRDTHVTRRASIIHTD